MKLPKEKIIEIAKESGIIFNTNLLQSEVFDWHRKRLYHFASLIEKELQTIDNSDKNSQNIL